MASVIRPGARDDPAFRWFGEARFGMFIHFLPEYVLERRNGVKRSDYRRFEALVLRQVNPTRFSAGHWLDVAEGAGCRYVTFVAKHGPGFCWWDTKTTDFKVTNTPFGRDVLRELAEECGRRGMPLAVYLNPGEWHNRHMPLYEHGGWGVRNWKRDDDDPSWDKTFDYMAAQVTEILTNYEPISGIWFDGSDQCERQWRGRKLYELIKGLQPACLVNDRCGYGDFLTPEYHMREDVDWRRYLVEQCTPASEGWGWDDRSWQRSAVDLVDELVRMAGCGSNYLLNVGPRPDGLIDEGEADPLMAIGRWLRTNGEAIYATEPVRLDGMAEWMRATRPAAGDGPRQTLYVHLRRWPRTSRLTIPGVRGVPQEVQLLGGAVLKAQMDASGSALVLDGLPGDPGDAFAKVLRLRFGNDWPVWESLPPARLEVVTPLAEGRPTPLPIAAARAEGTAVKYYQHAIRELVPPDAALVYDPGHPLPGGITTDLHELAERALQVRGDRHATVNFSRLGQLVVWTLDVPRAMRVKVRVRLRCSAQHAGSVYVVRCADAVLKATVRGNPPEHERLAGPDWFKGYHQLPFVWEDAGEIDLPPGRHDLTMEIDDMPYGCFFADVAALELTPVRLA